MNDITIDYKDADLSEVYTNWYDCTDPSCSNTLIVQDANYCSECGAAINWIGESDL